MKQTSLEEAVSLGPYACLCCVYVYVEGGASMTMLGMTVRPVIGQHGVDPFPDRRIWGKVLACRLRDWSRCTTGVSGVVRRCSMNGCSRRCCVLCIHFSSSSFTPNVVALMKLFCTARHDELHAPIKRAVDRATSGAEWLQAHVVSVKMAVHSGGTALKPTILKNSGTILIGQMVTRQSFFFAGAFFSPFGNTQGCQMN